MTKLVTYEDDQWKGGWNVARLECVNCAWEWVGVFPAEADEETLECPVCGASESEVLEYIPPSEHKRIKEEIE